MNNSGNHNNNVGPDNKKQGGTSPDKYEAINNLRVARPADMRNLPNGNIPNGRQVGNTNQRTGMSNLRPNNAPVRPQNIRRNEPFNGNNRQRPFGKAGRGDYSFFRLPFWAFMGIASVFCELLLLILGVSESGMRFLYVLLTGGSIGVLLGTAVSLIKPKKARRIACISLLAINSLIFTVEFFVCETYGFFMNFADIIFGAGGVATGFADIAINLVLRSFWVVILFFLPLISFFFLERYFLDMRTLKNKMPLILIVSALAAEMLSIGIISLGSVDGDKLSKQYTYDTAVKAFGLTNANYLDFFYSLGGNSSTDFDIDLPPVDAETDPAEVTGEGDVTPPAPIEYGKNEVDIDFVALAESESNKAIKNLHAYVASQPPSSKNEYTGLFEGKNLILITAEAFSAEVIDKERTPTLYRLANNGIQFKDYYQPAWGGSTSTGEYSVLMGLVPTSGVKSIQKTIGKNLYMTMGNQLQRLGYESMAFHNGQHTYYSRNKTHENFGYSEYIAMGNGMEEGVKQIWPASDLEMFDFTFEMYKDKQPFSIYYMTVSGHCLYSWTGNSMSKRNRADLDSMMPDASETIKAYHAANYELELGLSSLVAKLEEAGIADDTVIVISTDHYPYGLEEGEDWGNDRDYLSELYGYAPDTVFERDHSALIIWSGCLEKSEPIIVNEPTFSLDILPTLSNLFGTEFDSRLMVGRDVFSDAPALVFNTNYDWKTDLGTYFASSNKFVPKDENTVIPEGYVEEIKAVVRNKIRYCTLATDTDYMRAIFG